MPFLPTERQRQAINGNGSLLVSAAAGSGKTAVLVERILRRLTDEQNPIDANRLLVVTFTKAAAGEMRLRLTERLSREVAERPGNLRLLRQQMLMQKACISTMDSFCYALVREFPEQTGLSGDFALGTGGQLSLLETAAIEQMLEEMYSRGDGALEALVEVLGADRGDDSIVSAVRQIVGYIRSLPFPDAWMDSVLENYRAFDSVEDNRLIGVLFDRSAHRISDQLDRIYVAIRLAADDEAMAKARGEALQYRKEYMEHLQRVLDGCDWDGTVAVLNDYTPPKVPNLPRGYDDLERKEAVENARSSCDKAVDELRRIFAISADECVEQVRFLIPRIETLLECVRCYLDHLAQRKQEKGIYDFADIEYAALHLLVERKEDGSVYPTVCAEMVAERFDEVLVDEFQDINQLQYAVFHALSAGGDRLFAVGDVKQSIYGFRQASPEIFLGLLADYTPFDGESSPSKVILDQNFRSREGVCQAVNFVFGMLMSSDAGGLRYDEEHRLVPGAQFPPQEEASAALHLLETKNCTQSAEELEADHIARMILDAMSRPSVTDSSGEGLRAARYRDFAVLLRAKSKMQIYADRLRQWGIPVWTDQQSNLLSSKEVTVMLSLLRVIDNPLSDVALMAAMVSPIFGFTADEIARIRAPRRVMSLYAAVIAAAKEEAKFTRLLEKLEEYRLWAATMSCDRLIERLYDQTGYLSMVQAMENGRLRRANLLQLLQYARDAQAGGVRELSGFLRFLNRLEQAGESLASAGVSNESDDVVRIMTIHRSKGLQFPICILAGCSSEFNMTDVRAPIVLHREGGIGLMVTDDATRLRRTTVLREAVSALSRQSAISEELRVLYVAMTRAQEKLVVLISCKDANRTLNSVIERFVRDFAGASDSFDPYHVLSGRSYADWLLACTLVHPSGDMLRQQTGFQLTPAPAEGMWEVLVRQCADVDLHPTEEQRREEVSPSPELIQEITERLSYRYPFAALNGLAAKRSVSQLVKQQEGSGKDFACQSRPAFLMESSLTSAERGTALHAFMQYADYERAADDLEGEQERLVAEGFLTREQVEGMDTDRLAKFFQSSLYHRMCASPRLEREVRFLIELSACELDDTLPDWGAEETVMVQGIADCVFVEDDRLVILDYKTDRVRDRNVLIERYAPQLELYARALGATMGLPVGPKLIYSFWLGEIIELS